MPNFFLNNLPKNNKSISALDSIIQHKRKALLPINTEDFAYLFSVIIEPRALDKTHKINQSLSS